MPKTITIHALPDDKDLRVTFYLDSATGAVRASVIVSTDAPGGPRASQDVQTVELADVKLPGGATTETLLACVRAVRARAVKQAGL